MRQRLSLTVDEIEDRLESAKTSGCFKCLKFAYDYIRAIKHGLTKF